jgi:diaminopimelate decarboxylase
MTKALYFPPGSSVEGDTLVFAGKTITVWADAIGQTPFFLYDSALMQSRMRTLRAALPKSVHVHYAMKANPHPKVVEIMDGLSDGLDIASGGELTTALAAGVKAERISFAGPGKTDSELAFALSVGVLIILESSGEALRVKRLALALGCSARVAVRVNPMFELRGSGMRMGGRAQPFGVDEDQVPELLAQLGYPPFDFHGFHIYAGSQTLSAELVIESQEKVLDLILRLSEFAPRSPRFINLGGGFGIPYFPGDTPLDVSRIGKSLESDIARVRSKLPDAQFILELGRYLVGEAGIYVTKIIDRKRSFGETFLVTDGGLHHQLATSGNFGQVLRRNYPLVIGTQMSQELKEVVTVVGCLCTPLDRLGEKMSLPNTREGDLVVIFQAGAYGPTASPIGFLSHPIAPEWIA